MLSSISQKTKRAIVAILLIIVGAFLALAAFGLAGIAGSDAYRLFDYLLGWGYLLLPLLFFALGGAALRAESAGFTALKIAASLLFVVAGLGFVDVASGQGGFLGRLIAAPAVKFFDIYATLLILGGLSLASMLIVLEGHIALEHFSFIGKAFRAVAGLFKRRPQEAVEVNVRGLPEEESGEETREDESEEEPAAEDEEPIIARPLAAVAAGGMPMRIELREYAAPPLSLLERDKGKPGVGDIKANANIIKRTLANFGIQVELDEISIGPSVTRYAIKPAEGVRLSKIVALQQNLELALAAHPVRIEAPIPGKSLVGIEVPNLAKTTVGLGTMLGTPEFSQAAKPLMVALGRDIAGASHFANLAKMPHLLIAGATGSGKSVSIHALITSLLYRNGPGTMRFLMIDPKRVELTLYNKVPHLLSPVITDPKKAITALRWAGKEMERRYNILETERVRDIESYHGNVLAPALKKLRESGASEEEAASAPEAMPYIVIIIDELADIMQSYPRELEAAVVRLAQMSRAVGIHLVLSTQRPSVNVITGLIKANIPARVALQVASQVDSRTIIDGSGAEKLLGAGDMLYLSGDMGKPVRLQSAFIGENEVKRVADYVAKNNDAELPIDLGGGGGENGGGSTSFAEDDEVDDELYEAAHAAVLEANKASTSYLQRKLRIGYARAARLIDILEERGVIGPGEGAKPREVLGRSSAPEEA